MKRFAGLLSDSCLFARLGARAAAAGRRRRAGAGRSRRRR